MHTRTTVVVDWAERRFQAVTVNVVRTTVHNVQTVVLPLRQRYACACCMSPVVLLAVTVTVAVTVAGTVTVAVTVAVTVTVTVAVAVAVVVAVAGGVVLGL